MSLRHLCSPRLSTSLLSAALLFAGTFQVHAAEEMLRKAVGKGAYEMAVSQQENALWVATSQSRKTDKVGLSIVLILPRWRSRRPFIAISNLLVQPSTARRKPCGWVTRSTVR